MIRPAMLSVLALAVCTGCTSSAHGATRGYTVTDFSKLRVEGPFDVRVHVGAPASAKASGPSDALDRLEVTVSDDTLVIRPKHDGWGGWPGMNQGRVTIDVGARSLTAAALAGSGDVTVDRVKGDTLSLTLAGSGDLSVGAADVTSLTANATGSGDLTVSGRARQGRFMLTGSGDVHGGKLNVDDASVQLIGSGDITVGAQHTAKVDLAGSGDITIAGPANCAITRSGSGDVTCAHQSAGMGDDN